MSSSLAFLCTALSTQLESLDLATTLENHIDDSSLSTVCSRLSHRCTSLTLSSTRGDLPGAADVVRSTCASVQSGCEDLLALWQLWVRDKSTEVLMLATMRPLVVRVLESVVSLAQLLDTQNGKNVTPGTGLVWEACDALSAFQPTTMAVVCAALEKRERLVDDTAKEISELEAGEDDNDDGDDDFDDYDQRCNDQEFAVAQACVGALKGARGILRGCVSVLRNGNNNGIAVAKLEAIHGAGIAMSLAAEDLGCSLYPPQDADEIKKAHARLCVGVDQVCALFEGAVCEADATRVKKMHSIAIDLCKKAQSSII
jgi:hypothetical protein